jgi:hypothetical protein
MLFRLPRFVRPEGRTAAAQSSCMDVWHVFVLASFALTQPVYDRLGARPAFLVRLGVRPPVIFLVIVLLSLLLPAAIAGIDRLAWLCARRVRDVLHVIMIYVLLLLLALPMLKRASFLSGTSILTGALIVAAIATWGYLKTSGLRTFVTFCTLGLVVFPAVFLFSSSATSILFPPQILRPDRWNPVPTVVLVFDELCGTSLMNIERTIDADRFPNLAKLSRQATWFRNAATVDADTERAVPAILSGKYSTTYWPPVPADLPQNLFSVLESAGGYDLAVFEPVTSLAPNKRVQSDLERPSIWQQAATLLEPLPRVFLHHVAPRDLYKHLPPISDIWYDRGDSQAIDRTKQRGVFRYGWTDYRDRQFDHFLSSLDETSRPTLYFMHMLLPHVPWSYLPSGRRYTEDFDKLDLLNFNTHSGLIDFWGQDEWLVVQSQQRYLLQLGYLDRLIGRLTDRLRETGLYDRCLLIVTADHGIAFRANLPRRMAEAESLSDIASIPLFIKRPFQTEGEINDRAVESVDILPTIADVLGIKLSDPIDGRSVFNDTHSERSQTMFFQDHSSIPVDRGAVAASDVPQTIRQRFGDGHDPTALFRVGPIPELLGRQVESLIQVSEPPVEIELLRFGDTVTENSDELVPCFYEGRVQASALPNGPIVVAVAVNGTIRAVTRTYLLDGFRDRWGALVPESSFHPGKNDVQFFVVTGTVPDWRLSPCTRD